MRIILFIVAILVFSTAVTVALLQVDTYYFITIGQWEIENTNLLALVALFLLGFVSFMLLIKLIRSSYRLLTTKSFQEFQTSHNKKAATDSLNKGLIDLIECNWKSAENNLLAKVDYSETPLLNYLGAARAASQQSKFEHRDQYLRAAHEHNAKADIAILLTQADLQLSHQQTEQALATLSRLRQIAPRHGYVLKLLSRLHHQLREWDKLASILPELRKKNVLTPAQLESLELDTYKGILEDAAKNHVEKTLSEAWKSLPKVLQKDTRLSAVYASALISQGDHEEAEKRIRSSLNKHWDDHLAQLYGQLKLDDHTTALSHAKQWADKHPQSAGLSLTLGRLNRRARLWGEAEAAYKNAISLNPSVEAYSELADMLDSLGKGDQATELYKSGIKLSFQK